MFIKNKICSIIYKSIIGIIGVYGVLLYLGVFGQNIHWEYMNYYTILSNILCCIYIISSVLYLIINYKGNKYTFLPMLKGGVVMCITVTMLIYHFMLLDNTFNISLSDKDLSNLIVHYIFPISIILDYLLFDKKGNHKKYYPVAWCILPYIYMIYVFLRVGLGNGFTVKKGSIYPYDFVDIDKLGISSVVLNIVILTIAFIALGYVIYFLDRKLKINNKG